MPIQQLSTVPINWLWQSESWVIWNDGVSLPVFYDATDPNSTFIRRSIGNNFNQLGTISGPQTVPAIGNYALYATTALVAANVGATVLIGGQLYFLQSASTSGTAAGRYPVVFNLLTPTGGIASGDAIAPGTVFNSNTQNVGFITAAVNGAIGGGGSAITTFPSGTVPSPSVVFTISEAGFIPVSGTKIYFFPSGYTSNNQYYAYGTVTSYTNTPPYTFTINITNYGTASAGQTIPGTTEWVFNPGGGINQEGPFSIVSSSPSTWPSLTAPVFTLTLSSANGVVVGNILSVNGSTFKVQSVSGNLVQCTTVTGAGNSIPIFNNTPSIAQLVINTSVSAAYSSVATYPLTNGISGTGAANNPAVNVASGSTTLTITPGSTTPQTGQIVQITSTLGNTYLYEIGSVGASSGTSTSYYIYVQNLNDTPGNTVTDQTVITTIPELPAGKMGTYGMGRNWMGLPDGRTYMAGDIVGGASGNQLTYKGRDSVLKVSENDMLAGGGSFTVPGNSGFIQAMQFIAQLDVSLGQGPLQVLTSKLVFSCNAPVDRTTWSALTNPIQAVSLAEAGGVSQNAVTQTSGDLLFRSYDGQIRSLLLARLDFDRWGNTPVSREMATLIEGENDLLLGYCSSVNFDNRFLLTANPIQAARGVYFPSIIALNFDPYSGMAGKQPAVYDGEWQGTNILQLITGDAFNGGERCFALALDSTLGFIQLVEIMPTVNPVLVLTEDNGITPITSYFESPALFDGGADEGHDQYKRLTYGEIYIDSITSDVQFQVFYLSDQWPNWVPWASFTINYDGTTDPGFRPRIGLPKPSMTDCDPHNKRPLCEGYTFQVKIQATGYYRFLGGRFRCEAIEQSEYHPPVCNQVVVPPAFTPAAPSMLYAGPSPNPVGVLMPQTSASSVFYYTDGPSPSLWFWSALSKNWLPIIWDQVSTATGNFFTQGGSIIIGGLAVPTFFPPVPTQPALYYQDNPEAQLYAWSVKGQSWLPFITGSAANVAFPTVAGNGRVIRGSVSVPTIAPGPKNGAALYVQDSPNIQLYAWSVLTQSWFGIIQS